MLNFILFGIIVCAIGYIAYNYTQKQQDKECDKIEYRYRPYIRTFKEEQQHPVSPFALYKDLFYKPGPWWSKTDNAASLTVGSIQPATWVGLPKDQTIRQGEDSDWQNSYFG